jgi:hypothetical protein
LNRREGRKKYKRTKKQAFRPTIHLRHCPFTLASFGYKVHRCKTRARDAGRQGRRWEDPLTLRQSRSRATSKSEPQVRADRPATSADEQEGWLQRSLCKVRCVCSRQTKSSLNININIDFAGLAATILSLQHIFPLSLISTFNMAMEKLILRSTYLVQRKDG